MNQYKPGSIVVGLDVGGPTNGFHPAALQDGQYHEQLSESIAEKVQAGDESAEQIHAL